TPPPAGPGAPVAQPPPCLRRAPPDPDRSAPPAARAIPPRRDPGYDPGVTRERRRPRPPASGRCLRARPIGPRPCARPVPGLAPVRVEAAPGAPLRPLQSAVLRPGQRDGTPPAASRPRPGPRGRRAACHRPSLRRCPSAVTVTLSSGSPLLPGPLASRSLPGRVVRAGKGGAPGLTGAALHRGRGPTRRVRGSAVAAPAP